MTSNIAVLRKILKDCIEYCCLCFQNYEENDNFYTLQDEILFETKTAETLYEILDKVLGEQVIHLLSTNVICQKCTETTISSYKFIMMCKNNVWTLAHRMISLENSVKNITQNITYKSLFLALDTDNNNVEYFYDEKQHKAEASLHTRFKYLQRKSCIESLFNLDTIDIEVEPEWSDIYEFPGLSMSPTCNVQTEKQSKKYSLKTVKIKQELSQFSNDIVGDNNYKCKDCSKVYQTNVKLKQHYMRVHAPKEFQCSKCPRNFGTLFILNRHIKESHCTVVCSRCGKTYNNVHSLRHHEKTHDNACLMCQTCGKVYKEKKSFNNHVEQKMCGEDKPTKRNMTAKFECGYCQKKYSHKGALRVHIRLQHENGKALICNWCGKRLASLSRLNDHILTHTKQRNFSCDICGGTFVTKASLLYHTRTHTGEKPYKCDYCAMRFLSASRRTEHMKRHHGGTEECDICHSKFNGQTLLKKHRQRHFNVSSRLTIYKNKCQ